jgi:hypothetical protein
VRQIMIALACLALTAPAAFAGPGSDLADTADDLRARAQARAEAAARHPAALATPLDFEDPFLADMEAFAADAMRVSHAIEDADGPSDLRCIFRGMSHDTEARLSAIDEATTGSDRSRAYSEIANLMRDAVEIAPEAD